MRLRWLLVIPLCLLAPRAEAQLVKDALADDAAVAKAVRENYTKYEYRIAMRDGVKLFTTAYVPKDRAQTYPILMERTPYGVAPYGIDNYPDPKNARQVKTFAPSAAFVREGFVFVHQDVRGTYESEGTFVDVRPHAEKKGDIDESTDAYDTIDFLVKNVPNNNGKVGTWGISYPGFYAAQSAVDAHPALKAVSPQAPVTDWFMGDDFHHNGAFFFADSFDFYSRFGRPRPKLVTKRDFKKDHDVSDIYDFFLALGTPADGNTKYLEDDIAFWKELVDHPNRDAWWRARDPRPSYRNVKPAVMTVGGFFDAEDCFGALETYRAFERQSPGADNTLVMGPWSHGGWTRSTGERHGDIVFGQKTSKTYEDEIALPFFVKNLKGKGKTAIGEAVIFETGTNEWQHYTAWPPRDAKKVSLFFQGGHQLATAQAAAEGFDEWVSDPARPVPYRSRTGTDLDHDYMSDDQRFSTRRPDVETYALGPLTSDVTLAGPLEAKLWVATTGTDADFVVKLVDQYPDDAADPDPNPNAVHMGGYQELIRGEIMRGRFRESFEKPIAFEPGKPSFVHFTLPDISHTFRTGHRLLVQVQSSWFPLVDRNPQTFVPNIEKAQPSDFKAASHRVYHTPTQPSLLEVTVARGVLR